MLLAGDIGGTKCRFALYGREAGGLSPLFRWEAPSSQFCSAADALEAFLTACPEPDAPSSVRAACIALAGTRVGESYQLVNLGWRVEGRELASLLPESVSWLLCNDMEALAAGLPLARPEGLRTLLPGGAPCVEGTPRSLGLLAPGTGLGKAFVLEGLICPSEGGHRGFAPGSPEEIRLWTYLHGRFGAVSVERVLSGPALVHLARFAALESDGETPARTPDTTEAVVRQALSGSCPACVKAARLWAALLAREAGNVALDILPRDGIFLGGGLVPALLPFLETPDFRQAFLDKGRFSRFLENIPVTAVLEEDVPLRGSALLASRSLDGHEPSFCGG